MGWKSVKEHYKIEHQVTTGDKGIVIGSPYIHDLIVVGWDGRLTDNFGVGDNDELSRYWHEMEGDIDTLKRLIEVEDVFERAVPVYTFDGGTIITRYCEEPGWPNTTHCGHLMYENTYSQDREKIVAKAKRNAALGVTTIKEQIDTMLDKLEQLRALHAREIQCLIKLNEDYPDIEVPGDVP